MRLFRALFLLAGCLGLSLSVLPRNAAQAAEAPPLSAYGELPEVEDAALSPSGKRIAALVTINGNRTIIALDESGNALTSINVQDLKVRSFDWIGEERILLFTSQTEKLGFNFTTDRHEFYMGSVLPVDRSLQGGLIFGNRRNLLDAIFGNFGVRQIDGRWYGFFGALELERKTRSEYSFKHGRPFLYRVDLQDFTTTKISNSARENEDRDWLVDAKGEVVATHDSHDDNGKWSIRSADGKIIASGQTDIGRSGLIGLGFEGKSIIYYEGDSEGRSRWFEIPLSGGEPQPFLKDADIDRLYFDDQTGHMIGYLSGGDKPEPKFIDEARTKAAEKVRAAFANLDMSMIDWTGDLSQMIVRTSGNLDSGSWFTVDIKNLSAKAFAYERMAIGPEHVGAISTFQYSASDGMEMDGILTLPPEREATNLPAIILPHGGPHSYDSEQFDWWAQAFASRGYAVFQPNFRGSTNRTGSFRRAGYGEWGRKMQTDKSDGLAALAEAGIVDPARTCIVGASYGGYAALAGVTLQQEIYRCAVAVAPVTDLKRMYQEDYRATNRARTTKEALLTQLGPRESWDDVSPWRFADKASAPILLIHGKDDTVVPYTHSTRMADALKDAGKPYELVTLEGEDHWLSLSNTRYKMLEAAMRFVIEHNPPD